MTLFVTIFMVILSVRMSQVKAEGRDPFDSSLFPSCEQQIAEFDQFAQQWRLIALKQSSYQKRQFLFAKKGRFKIYSISEDFSEIELGNIIVMDENSITVKRSLLSYCNRDWTYVYELNRE